MKDKPHGPVGAREMQRMYGAATSKAVVTETLSQTVERQAKSIEEAMTQLAWKDDEIERLRIERDEARKTTREWSENCGAEVQRLRSVLQEIADGTAATWISDHIREALGDD